MTSVGVMASGVSTGDGVVFLLEDGDNFTDAPWVTAGSPSISASGHTGNAFSIPSGSSGAISYNIPAGFQTDKLTFGAWVRWAVLSGGLTGPWISFRSDAGATSHCEIRLDSAGNLAVFSGVTNLGGTVASGMTVNTWYYLEASIRLHDTLGTVTVRRDGGAPLISLGSQDTKNAGTKTVFDQFRLHGQASTGVFLIDDIYLRNDLNFGAT